MSAEKGFEPRLSVRLARIADHVSALANAYGMTRLAEIGCDHALVPVSLLVRGDIAHAAASDIREGPLRAARENAARYGVEARMRFVLADGLQGIEPGEADICLIAGMGGELIRTILETGDPSGKGIRILVLSPHTKQETVREYLSQSVFRITDETMTEEDGKYYPVITACMKQEGNADTACPLEDPFSGQDPFSAVEGVLTEGLGCTTEDAKNLCLLFGPLLLRRRDPVLKAFLDRRKKRLADIAQRITEQAEAAHDVAKQTRLTAYALQWFAKQKTGEST